MMSWGTLTADKFVKEAKNFLASNPFAEDGSVDCATVCGSFELAMVANK